MRRLVILNPKSRNGQAEKLFHSQMERWEHLLGDFALFTTQSAGDAQRKVRNTLEGGDVDQIIIAGGDGTINEALAGYRNEGRIINPEVPLGIIDCGTGGDLQRTVECFCKDYCDALAENRWSPVDNGIVKDSSGVDHYFLNIASVGMAGEMLKNLKNSAFQNGSAAYFYHSLKTLISFDPVSAVVEFSAGESRELDIINLFVCNGQFSGGGMQWAPGAKLDDGMLRVTLLSGKRKLPLIVQSGKLYSGQVEKFPGAEIFATKEVRVKFDKPMSLETDGEVIEMERKGNGEFLFRVEEKVFPLVI